MTKRPRMPFPRQLSGVMQESLSRLGLSERLREAEIWRIWPEVVGETLACRAHPVRIINGTLTVAVSSAPWIQELRFMTTIMKEKLNSSLGAEVVRDIILKAGRVDKPVSDAVTDKVTIRSLTSVELDFIESQADSILDPETRHAFIELMRASLEQT